MSSLDCAELHFLLDRSGAIIAFQEKERAWAGALAFSSEELARRFIASSNLEVAEIVTLEVADPTAVSALIASLKKRPIRCLLLDLDYRSGAYQQVDFVGDRLGEVTPRQLTPGSGS
ncbi:MAG TPA: hypothetical protein VFB15_06695 [Candidatus Binataceae bacterium]|jgi:hypothetical protein|nr:hypothetical protein [Candidatus Binataceae bacterium]